MHTYRVEVQRFGGEVLDANNVYSLSVSVTDDRTHLLRTMKTYCYFAGAQALEIFTLEANSPDEWQRPEELMSMLARRGAALRQLRLITDSKSASRSDAQAAETLKAIESQWATCWKEPDWVTGSTKKTESIIRELTRFAFEPLGRVQAPPTLWSR